MKVLIDRKKIARRVKELGREIDSLYKQKEFTVVVVLKGAFVFAADLIREIKSDKLTVEFVKLRSYSGTKSGKLNLKFADFERFRGKELLIIEDIVDTGKTLSVLVGKLKKIAKSVKICSLFEKSVVNKGRVKIDFLGFDIPKRFVLGYGLDVDEKFRNLPDIVIK